jgi:polysaccharide biosynthesis/export protein
MRMRALIHSALLFGFAILMAVPIAAQTTGTATPVLDPKAIDEQYRIGFQDTLEVQVFRHPELTQRVNVNANGMINLFRLNAPLVAVCKTVRELANDVADAYRKDYLRNPEVQVVAVEQKSRAFAMMGAVEKPGQFMISRKVRLIELLAFAGGPTKDAGTRVLVARTGSTSNCKMNEASTATTEGDDIPVFSYRLADILEGKANLVMQPGDIASVMDADVIYVYGNVNKQGQVEIKEPLTLTQVLVSAEGLKSASDKSKIRVLRQKPGSTEREEFIYNLDDISKRKVPDPFLEPNDVVAVNVDKTKEIFNSIGRTMTQGIPSLFYRVP